MTDTADLQPVRRALLSVSDKQGIVDLAQALRAHGVELLSTGGTARLLREAGLPVTEVADYTGAPEIMDGRVKTLHPRVHGALLGRRGQDEPVMAEQGILPLDLLVVNLYPFEATVASPDCFLEAAVENIDIGGPAMIRAAAKNHDRVAVLTDSADYPALLQALERNGGLDRDHRYRLAAKAFAHTAGYDGAIANYLGCRDASGAVTTPFPQSLQRQWRRSAELRYGENPHQRAAAYRDPDAGGGLLAGRQIQGKALSFNNLADADAALQCVAAFDAPACVIVKHANPCGVAVGADIGAAYEAAFATDPVSAFGGIIAFNRPLDAATVGTILERQFVEVLLAPEVPPAAAEAAAVKRNVRLLEAQASRGAALHLAGIDGGLLVQDRDRSVLPEAPPRVVSTRQPDAGQWDDLLFAWRVAKFVKSNAIVYARGQRTLGVGAGQMSRVDSARIGVRKAADAKLELAGSVLASDAFFPFRDGIDQAAAAGVAAVIQPGGSMRDPEVIAAADEHGIAMVFTGMRHFRH